MDKRQAEKLVYSLYSNSDSLYIVRLTSYRILCFIIMVASVSLWLEGQLRVVLISWTLAQII